MYLKRIISLLLTIFLLSFGMIGYADNINQTQIINNDVVNITFNDIGGYDWAYEAIGYFARNGIVNGTGNGKFSPKDNVTREQFAKLLVLTFNEQLPDKNTEQTFSDVSPDRWSFPYIEAAKEYLTGYYPPHGKPIFDPAGIATREDIAVALVKMMGYTEDDLNDPYILQERFYDADDVSPNVAKLVAIAVEKNLIKGSGGYLRPTDPITRAETVVLLYRAMKASVSDSSKDLMLNVDIPETINTSTLYISGTTEPGAKVVINGKEVYVDEFGNFKEAFLLDKEGTYKFTIESKLKNKRAKLEKEVTYKTAVPELTINNIPETTNSNSIEISGSVKDAVDNYPTVYVNDSEVYVSYNGKWSTKVDLQEGDNIITIKAVNYLGKSTVITKHVYFNPTGPQLLITNCPETSNVKSVTISGTVKDNNDNRPQVYVNDKEVYTWYDGKWSADVELNEGTNVIVIKAVNRLGKTTVVTKTINFVVNGPVINLINFPDKVNKKSVEISGTVTDSNDYYPSLYVNDKRVYVGYGGQWNTTLDLNEGINKVLIKAVNKLGKATTIEKTIILEVQGPIIDVNIPSISNKNYITISGTISDNVDNYSKLQLYVNGRKVDIGWGGTWSTTIELNQGDNMITIKGVNSHGKETTLQKVIKFEIVPPFVTVNIPETTNYLTLNVTGSVKDEMDSNPLLTINGQTVRLSYGGTFSYQVNLSEGQNTITIIAKSKTGLETRIDRNVNVIILAPVLNVNVPETSSTASIQISGNVYDILDNTPVVTVNGTTVTVNSSGNWNYTLDLNPGINNVVIEALNKYGKSTKIEKTISYNP